MKHCHSRCSVSIVGEKLSKQILQRNTNIKKLRAKEKELSKSNENLRCVNNLGPVVRKLDSAIHRIVIFSSAVKMFKKL